MAKNVNLSRNGDELVIRVDLSKTFGPSKSGKTTIIASTEGNMAFDGVIIGLNVFKKDTSAGGESL